MRRAGGAVLVGLLLMSGTAEPATEACRISPEHGGFIFSIDPMPQESRCLIEAVTTGYSTSSTIGPVQTPISETLYTFLLDRPVLMAALMQALGLGSFYFSSRGRDEFWVDDGEGAQGVLKVVSRDTDSRIYYIDGKHTSPVFPSIRAKTAVFLKIVPSPGPNDHPAVETSVVSYTRFDDRVLAGLVRLVKPLVKWAVTRALMRQFSMTSQLGTIIAQEPERVRKSLDTLPISDPADRQQFIALLDAMPRPPSLHPASIP